MLIVLSEALVPMRLAGPTLVDRTGALRYWALCWAVIDGAGLKPSYLRKQLAAIDRLYRAVEERIGDNCLDRLLTDGDLDRLQPVLEGLFIEMTNRSAARRVALPRSWTYLFRFVEQTIERGASTQIGKMHRLQGKLDRLKKLYTQLIPKQRTDLRNYRALPAVVVEDLYELVDPLSRRNPFRSISNRYRNYALFLLLLHMGLRRGEACGLLVGAIKSGVVRDTGQTFYWLNVEPRVSGVIDSRANPADLKTPQSKRQLPIGRQLVEAIEFYEMNFRGRQEHPFLFSSQKGMPLSLEMVDSIFRSLSGNLSDQAKRELLDRRLIKQISPHDLRHTAAVFRLSEFLETGDRMEVALGKLRAFFGWSKNSRMPLHYAGAYFEERLATVWNDDFDSHIEYLRRLEG